MTEHKGLARWVEEIRTLCQPREIFWCDGSEAEFHRLCASMVAKGTLHRLNESRRPNSFLARSHPLDVARMEDRTFICSPTKDEAGPTNNWAEPTQMKQILLEAFRGSMRGRPMYVLPFAMGPLDSPIGKLGMQITDSPYVVANMRIMTHMCQSVLQKLGANDQFVPCLPSVGAPLLP